MRNGGDLVCQEQVELVTDYLEGCLSTSERRRFTAHLDGCADCGMYLAQMRLTIRVLGTLSSQRLARP
jgi:anti-sigma factor RsiW